MKSEWCYNKKRCLEIDAKDKGEYTVLTYMIVCPLVFLAGFVDSIAGGGGLISLPAYLIAGLPVHNAIGTNKLSSGMGTAVTTYRFWKSGFIPLKESIVGLICAIIGAAAGAELALLISDEYFKIILLIVLPVTALYVMFNKRMGREVEEEEAFSMKKTLVIVALAALVIGMYDGFYGPGTGTFLMLLLTGAARMSLQKSAGVTKVINLTTNLTSLAVYLLNGKVLFTLGLTAGVFSILGNYIGSQCFKSNGSKLVKPIMLFVLAIFFVKTLLEL